MAPDSFEEGHDVTVIAYQVTAVSSIELEDEVGAALGYRKPRQR